MLETYWNECDMEIDAISQQWKKPSCWNVSQEDDSIEVCDEEGDFVVSSITHNHAIESINEHMNRLRCSQLRLKLADVCVQRTYNILHTIRMLT